LPAGGVLRLGLGGGRRGGGGGGGRDGLTTRSGSLFCVSKQFISYFLHFIHLKRRPNVLLVGHLDAAKLSTFLGEFFHPDRRTEGSQAAFYHVRIACDNKYKCPHCLCVFGAYLSGFNCLLFG